MSEPTMRPSPLSLWQQADHEYPDGGTDRVVRYNELLRAHGFVIPAHGGKSGALPCGWSPPVSSDRVAAAVADRNLCYEAVAYLDDLLAGVVVDEDAAADCRARLAALGDRLAAGGKR